MLIYQRVYGILYTGYTDNIILEYYIMWLKQCHKLQAVDKVVPFLKKSLDLVASKLSLEVVPFWKTQANSGGHSATMFLGVFLFFLAFSLGLGI